MKVADILKAANTHHHGFDFMLEQPTAKCLCGAVADNPWYVKGEN